MQCINKYNDETCNLPNLSSTYIYIYIYINVICKYTVKLVPTWGLKFWCLKFLNIKKVDMT